MTSDNEGVEQKQSGKMGFSPAARAPLAGRVDLEFCLFRGKSSARRSRFDGLLRLMQPLYLDDSGQVTYILFNPGGAYFGEKYDLRLHLKPGSHVLFSGQSATRVHRTPRREASQRMHIILEPGSRLEYVPEQLIAYKDSTYVQDTFIYAAPDAEGFFSEIVTSGWDPEGEPFTYTDMQLRTELRSQEGSLVCVDNLRLVPSSSEKGFSALGYLEGMTHMATALIVGGHATGEHADRLRETAAKLSEQKPDSAMRVGVSQGKGHGVSWVLLRALGNGTDELNELIYRVNEVDRSCTSGQGRLDLRRY